MTDLAQRLDEAIARRAAGQRQPEGDLEPLLAGLATLEALRAAPTPDAATLAEGRQAFLAHAQTLLTPVSPAPVRRHLGWMFNTNRPIGPKEITPMKLVLRLALVLTLVFGGTTATAFAAQDSLPSEPLYGVKLITEDLRLSLAIDPIAEINLLTELAARRTQEMVQLSSAHRAIPAEVPARLESHLAQALTLAAGLNAPEAALEQIRQMTEIQQQAIIQARTLAPNEAGLAQAEQHLTQALSLADLGLADPTQLRNEMTGNTTPAMPTGMSPTNMPMPTMMPTVMPSIMPQPTMGSTDMPQATMMPTGMPQPTMGSTDMPQATMMPTVMPSIMPQPTMGSTNMPMPTMMPTGMPQPTMGSTDMPQATMMPTGMPQPTMGPTNMPQPSMMPTGMP